MRHRIARLGVVLAGVLSLIGLMSPPAHAIKTYTIDFVGQADIIGGGLGYPCAPLTPATPTPPVGTPACNVTATTGAKGTGDIKGTVNTPGCTITAGVNATGTTKPGSMVPAPGYLNVSPGCDDGIVTTKPKPNGKPGPQINVTPPGGNTRGFTFNETLGLCAAAGTNINKPKPITDKPPVEAGICTINASGVVSGYCGLSTGTGAGSATSSNTITTQRFTFSFKFAGIGGTLLIQGTATKQGHPTNGNLSAVVTAVPAPPPAGSCTNKAATTFTIVGGATLMFKNGTLP